MVFCGGGGKGCDVARCGGGFYMFCFRLVVDFDPMVVVVGFLGFVGGGGGVFFFTMVVMSFVGFVG